MSSVLCGALASFLVSQKQNWSSRIPTPHPRFHGNDGGGPGVRVTLPGRLGRSSRNVTLAFNDCVTDVRQRRKNCYFGRFQADAPHSWAANRLIGRLGGGGEGERRGHCSSWPPANTSLALVRGYGKARSQLPPSYSAANQNNTLTPGPAHARPNPRLAPQPAAVNVHARSPKTQRGCFNGPF